MFGHPKDPKDFVDNYTNTNCRLTLLLKLILNVCCVSDSWPVCHLPLQLVIFLSLSIQLWYYITDYWPVLRRPFCLDVIPIRELIVIAIYCLFIEFCQKKKINPLGHKPLVLGSLALMHSVLCVFGSILNYGSQISTNKTARGKKESPFILETADTIEYVAFKEQISYAVHKVPALVHELPLSKVPAVIQGDEWLSCRDWTKWVHLMNESDLSHESSL